MLEETTLDENVYLLYFFQGEDSHAVGRPMNGMSQKERFEVLVGLVLSYAITLINELSEQIMKDLNHNCHFLFSEIILPTKHDIVNGELLNDLNGIFINLRLYSIENSR